MPVCFICSLNCPSLFGMFTDLSVPLYLTRGLIFLPACTFWQVYNSSAWICGILYASTKTFLAIHIRCVRAILLYSRRCTFHFVYIIWFCQMAWLPAWHLTYWVPMHFSACLFLDWLITPFLSASALHSWLAATLWSRHLTDQTVRGCASAVCNFGGFHWS